MRDVANVGDVLNSNDAMSLLNMYILDRGSCREGRVEEKGDGRPLPHKHFGLCQVVNGH